MIVEAARSYTTQGDTTGRRSRQHVARFILVALYTGTRAGAVCGASLGPVQGSGWIDLERDVFYRKAAMDRSTCTAQDQMAEAGLSGIDWDRAVFW